MANAVSLGGPLSTSDLAQMLGIGSGTQNVAVSPGSMGGHYIAAEAPGWKQNVDNQLKTAPSADPNMKMYMLDTNDPMEIKPGVPGLPGVQKVADQRQMPDIGPMQGQLFLNPQIAPKVPQGSPRPFSPGEYIKNPDGSWSSEITATIGQGEAPELNGGRPTVVPTLWIVNGVPTRVDEDTAASYAIQSGLPFQSFDTNEAAETYSQQRENSWQNLTPETAHTVPSLWGGQ